MTEAGLDRMDSPSFSISRSFDFFVVGESVLMTSKAAFESLLNHREHLRGAYAALKMEPGFSAAIADFAVFDAFIGKNATHLRRMAVIKARGYYNNPSTTWLVFAKSILSERGVSSSTIKAG